jgi:UDP-2,3-diacylglucosamine pyrophosphatase LpxH
MRFLKKNNVKKTIIVLSDLHLGAGVFVEGKYNCLEDFYYDEELVELLNYYSSGDYSSREVELIINGDFLDFLSVPYVKYFDDQFWSEAASIEKLKLILQAHPEVFLAIDEFISKKNKKLVYILGNHDSELTLPKVKECFFSVFNQENIGSLELIDNQESIYLPHSSICLQHGHDNDHANRIDKSNCLLKDSSGELYLSPSWGSYFVTRVINKFKQDRNYINEVKPVKRFVINGLIYDTLFTLRFIISSFIYFTMVRFIYYFKLSKSFSSIKKSVIDELILFKDGEEEANEFLENNPEVNILISGHTHLAHFKSFPNGNVTINTGTWTKTYNLGFEGSQEAVNLTYAKLDILSDSKGQEQIRPNLYVWKGIRNKPFVDFN